MCLYYESVYKSAPIEIQGANIQSRLHLRLTQQSSLHHISYHIQKTCLIKTQLSSLLHNASLLSKLKSHLSKISQDQSITAKNNTTGASGSNSSLGLVENAELSDNNASANEFSLLQARGVPSHIVYSMPLFKCLTNHLNSPHLPNLVRFLSKPINQI